MEHIVRIVALSLIAQPLAGALFVDFNSPGDLENNFTTIQTSPWGQSNVGLGGSGAVDMGAGNGDFQVQTLDYSFAGNLASWSASLYFRGDATNFMGMGITSESAPVLDGEWMTHNGDYLPFLLMRAGNNDGGTVGAGSYLLNSLDGVTWGASAITSSPIVGVVDWYFYELDVIYQGGGSYDVTVTLSQAAGDGTVGSMLAQGSGSLVNQDLASDDSVYLYFLAWESGHGEAVDDFYTSAITIVPEPSAVGALAGLGALGLAIWYRRSGSQVSVVK